MCFGEASPVACASGFRWRVVALVVLAAVCAGGGCGRDGRVSVTGVVRFPDGSPVPRGVVRFEGKSRSGYAKIQPDGRYVLEAGGGTRGIRPGDYAVVVDSTAEPPVWDEATKTYSESKGLVDDRYAWPATSGLSCDVKGATVFDIVVEPPAK